MVMLEAAFSSTVVLLRGVCNISINEVDKILEKMQYNPLALKMYQTALLLATEAEPNKLGVWTEKNTLITVR